MDWLSDLFTDTQQRLFESVVQPMVFALGGGSLLEDAYVATGWLLVGLLQLAVLVAVIGPLQRWRPVEPVADRRGIRTDIFYTLIHRLGLFRVVLFFALDPLFDAGFGALRLEGINTFQLDGIWPGITDGAIASFILYLVVFDFVDYWIHRGQHQLQWWWSLHSLHHSQRQMTMWSDNRNHLLDDLLRDSLLVLTAQIIGVAPAQFVAIVALTQLSESLQHANLRLWFGAVGERLWVSPRFHRLHHSIGLGHESPVRQLHRSNDAARVAAAPVAAPATRLGGHNFGVLLPWWDSLFGTANFELRYDPTGIRDQIEPGPDGQVRNYGNSFASQQWLGLKRLVQRR